MQNIHRNEDYHASDRQAVGRLCPDTRRVYFNNRGKAIVLCVIGKKPLSEGVRLSAAHIDSPRLDLKPNPLYEDNDTALFKTHYYGGIKKYQWTCIPLSLHGVVVKKDGTTVQVNIGEDADDPQFVVTDLLPHQIGRASCRERVF